MHAVRQFLSRELVRLRVAERQLVIRRLHGAALAALIAIAVILVFAVGVFVGFHYPYRTAPAPPVPPGQTMPSCGKGDDHTLGSCLPQPTRTGITNTAAITASSTGPDFSNNDPVYGISAWARIAAHSSFEIDKVNESTGYIDPTASPMVSYARARHLTVGGYDFLHVCLVSPTAEAHVFAVYFKTDVGLKAGTLPPVGDAEYPPSPQCNARAWITAWIGEVHKELGRWAMLYTGAWWWNPHVGCWWPAHALAWVSGYTASLSSVPRPCGRSHIDLWQLSDHGYNGYDTADLSQWEDGVAPFRRYALTVTTPPKRRIVCFGAHWQHTALCNKVRRQDATLGQERDRELGYVKVSKEHLAAIQARLVVEQRRATAANTTLVHSLNQYGYHHPRSRR